MVYCVKYFLQIKVDSANEKIFVTSKSKDVGLQLVTSVLQSFLCTRNILPSLRIDGNLPSENVTFIKSVRGSLRGFLNCLKSLFGMLKGPVLLSFLRVWTALPLCLLDLNEMYLQRRRYTSKNIKKSWQTTDTDRKMNQNIQDLQYIN